MCQTILHGEPSPKPGDGGHSCHRCESRNTSVLLPYKEVRYAVSEVSLPPIAVEPSELADFRWERIFGNARPVELEIGTGKAGFLLRRAQAHPQRNFFGIEWANEFYRYALDRMRRWKMTNVRLLRTDAADFIRRTCPRGSLTVLHVYHPDPWPKRRHHKRRLFQPVVVEAAVECLVHGGCWAVQTDHGEYFEVIQSLLRGHPNLQEISFDDPQLGLTDERVQTNYEIKYLSEGRAIYRVAMRRK